MISSSAFGARLLGTYLMRDQQGHYHETVIMKLAMPSHTAALINEIGWDTLTAQDVWGLVERKHVSSAFQPLVTE